MQGSRRHYLNNLMQTLTVAKWSWIKDIHQRPAHQCRDIQDSCLERGTVDEQHRRAPHCDESYLICGHLVCPRGTLLSPTESPAVVFSVNECHLKVGCAIANRKALLFPETSTMNHSHMLIGMETQRPKLEHKRYCGHAVLNCPPRSVYIQSIMPDSNRFT